MEIAIPTYDHQEVFNTLVESFVNTTIESEFGLPIKFDLTIHLDNKVSEDDKIKFFDTFGSRVKLVGGDENRGTLMARISSIMNTTYDQVFIADADDFINAYGLINLVTTINSRIIVMATSAFYRCDESTMGSIPYDIIHLKLSSKHLPIHRCNCFVGSMWNGSVLRSCINDLIESKLLQELFNICNTDKIVVQEDEFLWMWVKPWLYNHHYGYATTWIPTTYYNAYGERINYNSDELCRQRNEWNNILKSYFKY